MSIFVKNCMRTYFMLSPISDIKDLWAHVVAGWVPSFKLPRLIFLQRLLLEVKLVPFPIPMYVWFISVQKYIG